MRNNKIINILVSIPVILIILYFIPFLGIVLIITKCFISESKKKYLTFMSLIITGVLIIVPKIIELIFNVIKLDIDKVPYLKELLSASIYNNEFIKYSKFIISVGVILSLCNYLVGIILKRLNNKVIDYIRQTEKKNYEISKQNDMEIKLKQEKAKNTGYVECPNCGSDNLVSDKFGVCSYCRTKLENKAYKG